MRNRLKVLRAEQDWTQADLANELEVSRQTINAIEKEKFDPSLPLAFKVARLFKMSIEDIFQDEVTSMLDKLEIDRRRASSAILVDLVADALALVQCRQAGRLDRGDMNEHVPRLVVGGEKAVSLGTVKPFYGSGRHPQGLLVEPTAWRGQN